MTFTVVLLLSLALLALTTMQAVYVFIYRGSLERGIGTSDGASLQSVPEQPPENLPEIALILCLRGNDPVLKTCLAGISAQKYSSFKLHIVVDADNDPTVAVVNEFFENRNVTPVLHVVSEIDYGRSLKCSALLEAIRSIPTNIQTLAFIDADTIPDPDWLRDLVAPLADESVGATTGNRWFSPSHATLGSYVRQLWNAAAIVQMDLYNIAWGGALAIKRSVIDECRLVEIWGKSFCEDTILSTTLAKHGFKVVRVPGLISLNTESTTVRSCFWWIVRQLITIRLYHPRWPLVKLHGYATTVGSAFAILGLVLLFILGNRWEFVWLLSLFIAFQFWNFFLLRIIERANLKIINSRQFELDSFPQPVNWPLRFVAYLLVQLIQPLACAAACHARRVRWRGINYEIDNQQIVMTEYLSFNEIAIPERQDGADSIS